MIFFIIWILLIGYAVFIAPGADADPVFSKILSLEWGDIDPLVFAVFNSLGLFPAVFLTLLLLNDRQKWPAWPFALVSFAAGAFALLPYFAFGQKSSQRKLRTPNWLARFLASSVWLVLLIVLWAGNLLTLIQGFSLRAYEDAFWESSLVSVMTVDWFVLWFLSVYTVRRFYPEARLKALAWIPIAGPVLVLLLNPALRKEQTLKRNKTA